MLHQASSKAESYLGTVTGVVIRVNNTELVQHLAHNDDAHPNCGQAGRHGSETVIRHRQRPEDNQDQIHHRWLQTNRKMSQDSTLTGMLSPNRDSFLTFVVVFLAVIITNVI